MKIKKNTEINHHSLNFYHFTAISMFGIFLCKAMHRLKCKLHDSTKRMLKNFLHCVLIDVHA